MDSGKSVLVVGAGAIGLWIGRYLTSQCKVTLATGAEQSAKALRASKGTRLIRVPFEKEAQRGAATYGMSAWEQTMLSANLSPVAEGRLFLGDSGSEWLEKNAVSMKAGGGNLQQLSGSSLQRMMTEAGYRPGDSADGLFDKEAFVVDVEQVLCSIRQTLSQDATIILSTVVGIKKEHGKFSVSFESRGESTTKTFDAVILATGAWSNSEMHQAFFPDVQLTITQERSFVYGSHQRIQKPLAVIDGRNFNQQVTPYCLPTPGKRKIRVSSQGLGPTLAKIEDESTQDLPRLYALEKYGNQALSEGFIADEINVCRYTCSSDYLPHIWRSPVSENLLLVTGDSGGGFSLAPALGYLASKRLFSETDDVSWEKFFN